MCVSPFCVIFFLFFFFFSLPFPSLCLDGPAAHPICYDWMDICYNWQMCLRRDSASAYRLHGRLELLLATPASSLRLDDYAASSHVRTPHRRHPLASFISLRLVQAEARSASQGCGHRGVCWLYMHCGRVMHASKLEVARWVRSSRMARAS
jgi:hypothetical protein